jgi:hypothetical protein
MVFHQRDNVNKINSFANKTMKIKEIQDEIVDEFPCLTTDGASTSLISKKPSVNQR